MKKLLSCLLLAGTAALTPALAITMPAAAAAPTAAASETRDTATAGTARAADRTSTGTGAPTVSATLLQDPGVLIWAMTGISAATAGALTVISARRRHALEQQPEAAR